MRTALFVLAVVARAASAQEATQVDLPSAIGDVVESNVNLAETVMGQVGEVVTGVMDAFVPAMEMAGERGRLGGRVGFNFGTGQLYTENRYDNRRRSLLQDEAAPAAPAFNLQAIVDGFFAGIERGYATFRSLIDGLLGGLAAAPEAEPASRIMRPIADAFAPVADEVEQRIAETRERVSNVIRPIDAALAPMAEEAGARMAEAGEAVRSMVDSGVAAFAPAAEDAIRGAAEVGEAVRGAVETGIAAFAPAAEDYFRGAAEVGEALRSAFLDPLLAAAPVAEDSEVAAVEQMAAEEAIPLETEASAEDEEEEDEDEDEEDEEGVEEDGEEEDDDEEEEEDATEPEPEAAEEPAATAEEPVTADEELEAADAMETEEVDGPEMESAETSARRRAL